MPDEKFNEKEREKREEKSPEEKWHRDPLGSVVFAFILIWAGIVLLLDNTGTLDNWIRDIVRSTGWTTLRDSEVWQIIALGAGLIIVIEIILRLIVPAWRKPLTGNIIWAVILIGLGLSGWVAWEVLWPTILIILGLSIILRGVFRKKE
jgi:hypothetical protein